MAGGPDGGWLFEDKEFGATLTTYSGNIVRPGYEDPSSEYGWANDESVWNKKVSTKFTYCDAGYEEIDGRRYCIEYNYRYFDVCPGISSMSTIVRTTKPVMIDGFYLQKSADPDPEVQA